ncbi:hypothetical protein ABCR94_12955 [Streptomyces sp. 21So2-11]|uniref:hypothetical protein n=1 Tax=Streptomyces sp. 21So2-11 TaxID=3144408 RepID=UPI00321A71A8
MSPRGRRAALPAPGAPTAHGLLDADRALVVRVFAQDGSRSREYDFGALPVAEGIQANFAEAFARRTAPGGGLTALVSVNKVFGAVVMFTRYLAGLAWPPTRVAHLAPDHLDRFYEIRRKVKKTAGAELGALKLLLAHAERLDESVVAKLKEPVLGRWRPEAPKASYSKAEFQRIVDAARSDIRTAARRIRHNRELLLRFRQGELEGVTDRRMELMDWVDRYGDVPRRTKLTRGRIGFPHEWVFGYGTVSEIVCSLHLSARETTAAAVLLTAMTGQNRNVVLATRAAHHRADGYTGATATAILPAHKPRRGRRAHMSLVMRSCC